MRLSCLPLDMAPDKYWPRPPGLPPLDRYFDERAAKADYQERTHKAEEKVGRWVGGSGATQHQHQHQHQQAPPSPPAGLPACIQLLLFN